jgi:hypothetical protein
VSRHGEQKRHPICPDVRVDKIREVGSGEFSAIGEGCSVLIDFGRIRLFRQFQDC